MIERSRVRIPAGAAGEFSSLGSTFCTDSYFGIRSTPVKDPGHSAKLQVAGYCETRIHLTYVALHDAKWSMVVWCTQNLRRDGSSFMWHQPCQRCKYTTSVDSQKTRYKKASHSCRITSERSESALESGEKHYISDHQSINNKKHLTPPHRIPPPPSPASPTPPPSPTPLPPSISSTHPLPTFFPQ